MAVDDRAIIVGITQYPDMNPLQGTERDAQAFRDWVLSDKGGDVPSHRVDYIVSSAFQPAAAGAPPVRLPAAQQVEIAFDSLHRDALDRNGVPRRLGRRLYVYAAGHGAALPFTFDPDRSDAALLVADATRYNATHVMARIYALYFLNAGVFDEIALFMDCCRFIYDRLTPRFPSYIDINAINDAGSRRRAFFAFATKWSMAAREKPLNGVSRGVFTTALIKGLNGAAANPDGTITSSSLRNYLLNHMKDVLAPEDLADPEIPKEPDIPPPAVELVFATVPPPRVTLRVTYPPAAANQLIRLRGDGFRIVASGQTSANGSWVWPDLQRGSYLVEIPPLNLEKDFTLLGNEGTFDVALA
jgi:hypothetical protein